MKIENNKVVSLHYVMKNEAGDVLQDNLEYMPEQYIHGHGNILPELERLLEGLQEGQEIEVVIPPEHAYGPKELSLILEVSHADLEDPASINEGDSIQLFDGTDAVVVEKHDQHLVVDANHPLAGQTLFYSMKVSAIRDASEEEILRSEPVLPSAGSCGPEGCC